MPAYTTMTDEWAKSLLRRFIFNFVWFHSFRISLFLASSCALFCYLVRSFLSHLFIRSLNQQEVNFTVWRAAHIANTRHTHTNAHNQFTRIDPINMQHSKSMFQHAFIEILHFLRFVRLSTVALLLLYRPFPHSPFKEKPKKEHAQLMIRI